jgi:threonine/homoserine/homoserine lactone efflux protein
VNTAMSLAAICAALGVGIVSPGPSFVMIARTSVALSRRDGLAASVGMGLGGVFFAVLALLGLQLVLAAVPMLYVALKLAGGAWLAYLGWRIWRSANQPLDIEAGRQGGAQTAWRSFLLGLGTQVSNPKTALVYASVFAAFMPRDHFPAAMWLLPPLVFVLETAWYALVAVALSAPAPRAAYLRGKRWIDRIAGGVLATLGLKLMTSAQEI